MSIQGCRLTVNQRSPKPRLSVRFTPPLPTISSSNPGFNGGQTPTAVTLQLQDLSLYSSTYLSMIVAWAMKTLVKKVSEQSYNRPSHNVLYYTLSLALRLGFLIVVPILVCFFLGLFFYKHFHTSPIVLILLTVIGFVSSIYNVYQVIKQILKHG